MFNKLHWGHYLTYAIAAAIVYCIPVVIYLNRANFTQAWLLYIGNFLFLLVIVAFLFSFNNRRREDASTMSMLIAGHITTITGIIITCLLCFILLIILVPGYLQSGTAGKVMANVPANTVKDKTNGLSFMLFMNAVIGNVAAGSASSIIFPFTLKRDQTKEKVPQKQAQL